MNNYYNPNAKVKAGIICAILALGVYLNAGKPAEIKTVVVQKTDEKPKADSNSTLGAIMLPVGN